MEAAEAEALVAEYKRIKSLVENFEEPKTPAVLAEVAAERARQDAKWGQQNHLIGGGAEVYAHTAAVARRECDAETAAGRVTWRHILLEEMWEVLAETDEAKARGELVQLAAVAVAAVEAIDRRTQSRGTR
jgi:hypothetical protein